MSEPAVVENNGSNKLNEKLPIGQLAVLGFQHVLAMYVGAVTIPLIIGAAVGLTKEQIGILICCDLFTCGIATILQAVGIKEFSGIRLPVVMGCSFVAIGPIIAIDKVAGFSAGFGSILIAGVIGILLAPLFGKLVRFFPYVVQGSIIMLIGFSLIPTAVNTAAGGAGSANFGEINNLVLATLVMIIILVINKYSKGFIKSISMLIGIIIGTIVAAMIGMIDFSVVAEANWIGVVRPFAFGPPKFTLMGIITMSVVLLLCFIESTGVYFGMGKLCNKQITEKDVVKGLRAESIATVLGGIFNCFPYTTYSQNMGLVSLTKVISRYVVIAAGIILMLLGFIPKFAALTIMIPPCVLGGAMIVMFGMVGVNGAKILQQVDLDKNNNLLIVACTVGIGLGVSVVPELFSKMPEMVSTFLSGNGIIIGSIVAIILNLFLNWEDYVKPSAQNDKESVAQM